MSKLRISDLHDDAGHFLQEVVTNIGLRRDPDGYEPRPERRRGSAMINTAVALLFVLAVALYAVSLVGQYKWLIVQRHDSVISWIEALALDAGMSIFTLLALGLARAGLPARAERAAIMLCAAGSSGMGLAAANDGSWRSILAYVMPPIFLAVVVDRTVATIRRHYLGDEERGSASAVAGKILLWSARGMLALPSTAAGARRLVLNATPLPGLLAADEPKAIAAPPERVECPSCGQPARLDGEGKIMGHRSSTGIYCLGFPTISLPPPPVPPLAPVPPLKARQPRKPRSGPTKLDKLVQLVTDRHGPLAKLPLDQCSKVATALAPEVDLHPATARSALIKLVRAAQDIQPAAEEAS